MSNFNIEKSYWNGNGKYQKEYKQLSKLTPDVGWSKDNDIYIDMLTAACNIYYRYYNDGDVEILEYNGQNLNNGIEKYKEDIMNFLENKKHYKESYWYIDDKNMLEDLINAIIKLGIKEKSIILESKNSNEWKHTGETENELEIWIKSLNIENEEYIQIKYIKDDKRIGEIQQYNIKQIRLLNSLIDNL